jgi:hypothetical protein
MKPENVNSNVPLTSYVQTGIEDFWNDFLSRLYSVYKSGSDAANVWKEDWYKIPAVFYRIYFVWRDYETMFAQGKGFSNWLKNTDAIMKDLMSTTGPMNDYKFLPRVEIPVDEQAHWKFLQSKLDKQQARIQRREKILEEDKEMVESEDVDADPVILNEEAENEISEEIDETHSNPNLPEDFALEDEF